MLEYCISIEYNPENKFPKEIKTDSTLESIFTNPKDLAYVNKLTDDDLVDLSQLADYIHFEKLVDLISLRIAYDFRHKENNIKENFGVNVPILPDIEVDLKKQFPWSFEIPDWKREILKAEMELEAKKEEKKESKS